MPTVTFVDGDGKEQAVQARVGASVMDAATGAGNLMTGPGAIVGECGGNAMCATCHVHVDPAWLPKLPAMTEDEDDLLESTASPRTPESRLSCQIRMSDALDGLRVRLPDRQV